MTKRYTMPTWEEFRKQSKETEGCWLNNLWLERDLYETIREALAVEDAETERLVGRARGEAWADVGGGEEKPVRPAVVGFGFGQVCPVDATPCDCGYGQCKREKLDHKPRQQVNPASTSASDIPDKCCGTCKFYRNDRDDYQRECQRYPEPRNTDQRYCCGEWRAK